MENNVIVSLNDFVDVKLNERGFQIIEEFCKPRNDSPSELSFAAAKKESLSYKMGADGVLRMPL